MEASRQTPCGHEVVGRQPPVRLKNGGNQHGGDGEQAEQRPGKQRKGDLKQREAHGGQQRQQYRVQEHSSGRHAGDADRRKILLNFVLRHPVRRHPGKGKKPGHQQDEQVKKYRGCSGPEAFADPPSAAAAAAQPDLCPGFQQVALWVAADCTGEVKMQQQPLDIWDKILVTGNEPGHTVQQVQQIVAVGEGGFQVKVAGLAE